MGRMLDSLVRVIEQPSHSAGYRPPHREPACVDEDVRLVDVDLPFIEVGAPGKKIEASPDVLAVPVPAPVPRKPAVVEAPTPKKSIAVPKLVEPRAKITLEPWPAPAAFQVPEDVVTFHEPTHPASAEYAKLMAKIERAEPQVVLFATASASGNLVTLALNLAFHAANDASKRILIVDAGADAALARATGLTEAHGLADVLAGSVALEGALQATPITNLRVLCTQADAEFSAEALVWVFGCLRKKADLLFVLGGDAAALTAPLVALCDDAYLVAADGADVCRAAAALREGDKLRGVIKWSE